jgi:hypothetical protein
MQFHLQQHACAQDEDEGSHQASSAEDQLMSDQSRLPRHRGRVLCILAVPS